MKNILILLVFINILVASENIPFGIKDVCDSIINEEKYFLCKEDKNKIKWISYTFENHEEDFRKIIFKNKTKIDLHLSSYNFFNQDSNEIFLTSINNENIIEELNNKFKNLKEKNLNQKMNIIAGLTYKKENDVKYQINNNDYYIIEGIYSIITNVETREILDISFLNFKTSTINQKTLKELKDITNITFNVKLFNK